MAAIAVKYATTAVFTSDNPRHESPEAILATAVAAGDGRQGALPAHRHVRRERPYGRDTLVRRRHPRCGQGHETYQVVGDVKHHFDDREEGPQGFRYIDQIKTVNRRHVLPSFRYLDEVYNLPGSEMFRYISFRAAAYYPVAADRHYLRTFDHRLSAP